MFTVKYAEELKEKQSELLETIIKLENDFKEIKRYVDLEDVEIRYKKCEETDRKLHQAQALADQCNSREGLLNQIKTDFSAIGKIQAEFNPHNELWSLASDYFRKKSIWLQGPIQELDGEELPKTIHEALRRLQKLQKGPFKEEVDTREICNVLKGRYQGIRPYLPIITGLKNKDFKIRHFDILRNSRDPPIEIEHDLSQSLTDLERIHIMELVDIITDISETATKERHLEG